MGQNNLTKSPSLTLILVPSKRNWENLSNFCSPLRKPNLLKEGTIDQQNLMTWNPSRVSTLCLLCYVLLSFGNSWEAHSFRENSNKLTNFCWFLLRSQLARKMAIFTKITRQMTKWKMTEQLSQKIRRQDTTN